MRLPPGIPHPQRPAGQSGARGVGPSRLMRLTAPRQGGAATMKVLIAGGGIGGCALALALHDAGVTDVEVFESVAHVHELGVGINLLPHAVRELSDLGLLDDLTPRAVRTGELAYYNRHGQRIWVEPRGLAAGYRWPQLSIHRGELL